MSFHSEVIGSGSYLPDRLVTNDDLAKIVDTTDEWVVERTGIRERHLAADGELTSDLALAAAKRALQAAGTTVDEIDVVVLATTTPDETFPATATKLQAALGMTRGIAFDIQAVCSGFIYALAMADNMIRLGQVRTALVVGAETFSRLLDWTDRGTCVLFGDGAGAFVLKAAAGAPESIRKQGRGVVSTHLYADGRQHDILYTNGGVSSTRTAGTVQMAGKEVFKFAVANMAAAAEEALADAGLAAADIDWLVPHQANKRIIDATARKLHLPAEKVVLTVGQHANTSAASIPLAFDVAVRDGRIKRGQLVLLESMGAGMTWGASLIRW